MYCVFRNQVEGNEDLAGRHKFIQNEITFVPRRALDMELSGKERKIREACPTLNWI